MVREDFISTSLSIKDIRGAYITPAFPLPPWILSLADKLAATHPLFTIASITTLFPIDAPFF